MNKIITHDEYLKAREIIIKYRDQICLDLKDIDRFVLEYNTPLNHLPLSVRLYMILKTEGCTTLLDVITVPMHKMRKARNFGVKSEKELLNFKLKYNHENIQNNIKTPSL